MLPKSLSQIVWPVTLLTIAALAAVVTVLLVASSQAAIVVGLCSTIVLPVILGLLGIAKNEQNHTETAEKLDTTAQTVNTLTERVQNG